MEVLIIILLIIMFYSYLGYPLTLFFFSLFSSHKVIKDDNYTPEVSLLIAAYNEEDTIADKIKNSLELDYPKDKMEIVIVSDGSTDRTDEIVKSFESSGIKLFRVEGRVGKTEARNQAVLAMRREIIVFSDATAVYEKDAIRKLVRNFADTSVGMVSGNLTYFEKGQSSMGLATKLYWNYEKAIKKAQSKLYTLTGAVGCINAFRRRLYHVLPPNIIEDFTEPLMIVAQNYRIVYEEEAVSYERTTQKPSQEFKMRVRVIRGGMKGFIYAFRKLNFKEHRLVLFQLFGHKVLRWLMPVFLILLFIVNLLSFIFNHNMAADFLMMAQFICYAIALVGMMWKPPGIIGKVFSIPAYFVIINAASLKALLLTLTTDLEATWETNVY
ncbi:glycosyltransferase family 2 protein [Bacteriovorax sp. PP10]|uniref:Glycosyltransferase family 2 protein n=1 Tax=Bacteriovorax antarcticus TaxID=3088717 RepID=A0ABU5VUK2_9BACT|nr:glycosyltransferase family 2 protein [Bacteriovorax sp. PP10]MEA9355700.1 glycosyltransferase family 2 protein [Bacteriovorax sp. PP10]